MITVDGHHRFQSSVARPEGHVTVPDASVHIAERRHRPAGLSLLPVMSDPSETWGLASGRGRLQVLRGGNTVVSSRCSSDVKRMCPVACEE